MIKSLLNISDLSREQILSIIYLKEEKQILNGKNIGMLFEKYSTRTRLSFSAAISSLGGNAIDLRFEELNISRNESFEDTFRAFNCYLDGLVYRTDNHEKLIECSKYFEKNIINALSDLSHPCQTISDLYTLNENFNRLNLNILWMGDLNNVCFSLVELANLFDEINLYICSPKDLIKTVKWNTNKNIYITENLSDINLESIDCVMTDVFISMNDNLDSDKIEILSKYRVSMDIMSKTSTNSVFMHCLPANIGSEVSEDVFNSHKSIVWRQAYNRMVVQKKLLCKMKW